jgi:hypothetical protein
MKKKIFAICICMLWIATAVSAVEFQNDDVIKQMQSDRGSHWIEIQKLTASDGSPGDLFGSRISISGDYAIIGAYKDNSGKGAAYIYKRTGDTWIEEKKLIATDGAVGDWFGYSVSISGDYAIIGAPFDDEQGYGKGSAYIFTRIGTTWTQQVKLFGGYYLDFGFSVSISGDYAIVGESIGPGGPGAAYIFKRTATSWVREYVLQVTNVNHFGHCVSIDGDTVIIAAPGYDSPYTGAAYIFRRNSGELWLQEAMWWIGWRDPFSVSISGDSVIIGVTHDDENGVDSGAAYVFTRTGFIWSLEAQLLASDGGPSDQFGMTVNICGDSAIIGTHNTESIYVFNRSGATWTQEDKLTASDGNHFDGGTIYGNIAIVSSTESAYVFKKNQLPCPPTIDGPTSGSWKESHRWNFTATDPDNHDIFYYVDWGDGENTGWSLAYHSGDTMAQSHRYPAKGIYTIKVKAKDIYGLESDWGTLSVTMPHSYNIPLLSFWEKLLMRFPQAFPLLRYRIGI